jgi:ribosomal protein S18 acetylase RimI-like enzyme
MLVSRPYSSPSDQQPAIDLVLTCRVVESIDPWPPIYELRQRLRACGQHTSADAQVWERQQGELAALATLWDGMALVFSIHPRDLSEDLVTEILAWGTTRACELARNCGEQATLLVPICTGDRQVAALLERHGFVAEDWALLRMAHSLAAPIASAQLPDGWALRHVSGAQDLAAATALYQDVFVAGSSLVRDRLALSCAGDEVQALDLVAVAPDGMLAAFCLCTAGPLDLAHPARKEGWVELLGTRPSYRRRGIGRAMLLAGLERLKALGADRALLGTASWNVAAQQLFAAAGFRLLHEIRWYAWSEEDHQT